MNFQLDHLATNLGIRSRPFFFNQVSGVKLQSWLFSDAWIRQYLSTSPDVEKEDFAHTTKEALKVFLTHSNPLKTKFIGERPLRYERKPDGFWELKTSSSQQPGSSSAT